MSQLYLPGDYICDGEGCIKGHGTELVDNKIFSSYFGRVNQINKLVTVSPVFSVRYVPEIGDVVVGRVVQIYNKRWKIDTNARGDTTLGLGAINLPGVAQRRKSEDDEMNMHKYFAVNDMVVCEVQKVNKNGSAALHTRNDKYGKLSNGLLVIVAPDSIVAAKSRFITRGPVDVISGCNGYIWISSRDGSPESFRYIAEIATITKGLYAKDQKIDLENVVNKVVPF